MEAGERSNKSSRRVTFEIDHDGEFQQLIGGTPDHRVTPKSVSTRIFLYLFFIIVAVLIVGVILSTSGDSLTEGMEDTEVRGSATTLNAPSSVSGDGLIKYLQDGSLSLEEKLECFSTPDSKDSRVVSLYSLKAKKKLIEKLKEGKNFTLLANGGSTTAAAGHIFDEELFFVRFARYLEDLFPTVVKVVNMGHGARDSFHSFLMAESFFPPTKVDLIVWEFSMNDRLIGEATEQRNLLVFWLSKVALFYAPDPPPVMLVYYWSSPLSTDKDRRIQSDVFYAHDGLGAQFDFVLGHVHMGAFLDNLGWEQDDYRNVFLAEQDDHHPNALGHALTSMVMQELISDSSMVQIGIVSAKPNVEWMCKTDTEDQKLLREVLFEESLKSKASFIADLPRNEPNSSLGILRSSYRPNSDTKDDFFWREVSYGTTSDWRSDRHLGVTLPNCNTEGRLVLDVQEQAPIRAVHFLVMNGINGHATDKKAQVWHNDRQLGFLGQNGIVIGVSVIQMLRIWVGEVEYSYRIIDAVDWECQLSKPMYRRWLVLDDKNSKNATRIELCDGGLANRTTALTLEHLAVF